MANIVADSWTMMLAEKHSSVQLHRRDIQQDIQELGAMLGDVLTTQQSQDAFDIVESIRQQSIAHRDESPGIDQSFAYQFDDLTAEQAMVVARAFTTYFELINLAEERERIRALREQTQADVADEGLEEAADVLAGMDSSTSQRVLEDILIQPTFTAHPTEARRKTVKAKLRSIADDLETLDEQLLTDKEATQVRSGIRSEVTGLWQTRQVRERQPEPFDEALNVHWYLENVLFDIVGEVYNEFEGALSERVDESIDVPKLLEFRSWAGSDRDGNPYVTPDVTTQTLDRQRRVALDHYREELKALSGVLSHDTERIVPGDEVCARLDANRERLPSVAATAADRYNDEPYRQQLKFMRERLARVDDPRSGGYVNATELADDLDALAADLRTNGAGDIATTHVDPLVRQVETFGFTLASLDLRDHQENHTEAITEALAQQGTDYAGMDESERVTLLTEAIMQDESIFDLDDTDALGETSTRVFDRFDAFADWQREFGVDAIDTYCISMCEEPSHVLEVLFLADQAGIVDLPEHCGVDIVPLLETEYALSGARRIMGTLFENEAYAAALSARDGTQEIMLGYSDSNKENGFLAANWLLYRNQRRLADICDDYEVTMRLFHGQGGSISRGGGPMNEGMLALPNSTVTGQIKFTEQGEAIAEKYSNPRIAERNIEQMVNAQIRARKRALEQPQEDIPADWQAAMETMASAAREEYRDLLDTDGFVQYFEEATPITVIENLNLGSRPASRSDERTVEDLRAIPWVFSWTQSRCIMTSWYGLATGIHAYLDDGGSLETLQTMYEEWPFFRTTLDNAALSIALTDLEIAAEYAALAPPELCERFFPRLSTECERSGELIKQISQRDTLHTRDWLRESLDRRNPYVDPLNLLQVQLLGQDDRNEAEDRVLRLTVKGIAAGMKNTG